MKLYLTLAISMISSIALAQNTPTQTSPAQAYEANKPKMIEAMKQKAKTYESYIFCERRAHATKSIPADPKCADVHAKLIVELEETHSRFKVQSECMAETQSQVEMASCLQRKNAAAAAATKK